MNADGLERLVPGSKAVWSSGALIWTPPTGGAIISGKKQKGDGSQKEGQESLFTAEVPLWLWGSAESPWHVRDNKDGMKFKVPGWRMRHVHFLNSGEDCVTAYAGGQISQCSFLGDDNSDKCIQGNSCDGLLIENSIFWNFVTACWCGMTKYAKKTDLATVVDCKFFDCRTPIRAVVMTVRESNNQFVRAATGNVEDAGGRIV